jgi:hypothetical protein
MNGTHVIILQAIESLGHTSFNVLFIQIANKCSFSITMSPKEVFSFYVDIVDIEVSVSAICVTLCTAVRIQNANNHWHQLFTYIFPRYNACLTPIFHSVTSVWTDNWAKTSVVWSVTISQVCTYHPHYAYLLSSSTLHKFIQLDSKFKFLFFEFFLVLVFFLPDIAAVFCQLHSICLFTVVTHPYQYIDSIYVFGQYIDLSLQN